ncbi:DUF2142 domain-containing protein [uncultured Microbacterium sp.]|uniref:DUF2142 domain-containing protein n=1 Tax=uncultured Microbacterium sp. TaxID=191216 RepID=UPI00262CE6E3|nr:DUF2142 domain-containing protein [uncultured Microbacterium sp.]
MPALLARLALPRRPLADVAVVFVALLAILLSGAVFLPIASGADEAAHYVYAAAVVRGQAGTLEPTLPARFSNMDVFAGCIAFHPDVTAACQGPLRISSTAEVLSQTNAGLYNPVFYLWTGLGTLAVPTEYGLYLSRALAAVVTALFLAWGLSLLRRSSRSPLPVIAATLFLTPMTLYVGMVLNPSAWEIATLFAATVAGFAVACRPATTGWREEHSLLLAASCVLVVTRGLSPMFLALTAVALLVVAGFERTRRLLADRRAWILAGGIGAVTAFSVLWVLVHGTNYVGVEKPASLADGLTGISVFYSNYHEQVTQMYGNLGWLDLRSPNILSTSWVLLLGGALVFCFGLATRRARWAILLAFGSATLIPGVLSGLQWSGYGWQGRYTMPLVAALIVIAALAADAGPGTTPMDAGTRRVVGMLRWLLPAFLVVGVTITAVRTGHRYLAGDTSALTAAWQWTPPLAVPVLAVAFFGGLLVLTGTLVRRGGAAVDPAPASRIAAR